MRTSKYISRRRARYAYRTRDCKCHVCKAYDARQAYSRPADYEPDFDGPVRRSGTTWQGRE